MAHHEDRSANIMICSRDWQDMLDGQTRIAVALEAINATMTQLAAALIQQNDDREAMALATKDLLARGKEVKAAVDASPQPPA